MKIRILWSPSGAAYKPGDITSPPEKIAKGLCAAGEAEKAGRDDKVTYDWPVPEPDHEPAPAKPHEETEEEKAAREAAEAAAKAPGGEV